VLCPMAQTTTQQVNNTHAPSRSDNFTGGNCERDVPERMGTHRSLMADSEDQSSETGGSPTAKPPSRFPPPAGAVAAFFALAVAASAFRVLAAAQVPATMATGLVAVSVGLRMLP
jgi:hypothetical protein